MQGNYTNGVVYIIILSITFWILYSYLVPISLFVTMEIVKFCSITYDVTFPVLGKVEVNGSGAEPLFDHLKREQPGFLGTKSIKWNFTKFLVGRDGHVRARFAPSATPASLRDAIDKALAEPAP